jgi:hypothetical protein
MMKRIRTNKVAITKTRQAKARDRPFFSSLLPHRHHGGLSQGGKAAKPSAFRCIIPQPAASCVMLVESDVKRGVYGVPF